MPEIISEFTGQYRFLSNFYPCKIDWGGITFPSVEHAYQAAKTLNYQERMKIAALETPGQAKRAGRKVAMRHDWEDMKLFTMNSLVRQKFTRYPELKALLLDTGNQEIQEGNNWGDTFWGVCDQQGENHLGRILMQVRENLRRGLAIAEARKVNLQSEKTKQARLQRRFPYEANN